MKKGIAALLLSMTLTFGAGTVFAAEISAKSGETQVMDTETGGEYETGEGTAGLKGDPGTESAVYSVTINFHANGGNGSGSQMVSSNVPANLTADGFTRTDYTLVGWNTMKNGKGDTYKAGQDVTGLATEANNGQTITLYAQWKLNAPKLKELKATKPGAIKITYSTLQPRILKRKQR